MEAVLFVVGIIALFVCVIILTWIICVRFERKLNTPVSNREESVPLSVEISRTENQIHIDIIRSDKNESVCTVKFSDNQAAILVQEIVERLSA